MKLHEFFFFLQAHAEIFFSSSISCMNFFFGSDTLPPRISNGPPLRTRRHFYIYEDFKCDLYHDVKDVRNLRFARNRCLPFLCPSIKVTS